MGPLINKYSDDGVPMFLTKERLQASVVDPEKIIQFEALFPNGVELTREVCVEHADCFSFELDGMRILPVWSRKFYCDEIIRANCEHITKTQILRIQNRSRIAGPYNPMKDYPPPTGIFKWGPKIPGPPRRQLNKQEMDIFNEKLQAAAKEYRLKQAIALYEAINHQDLPMVDSSIP